MKKNSISNMVEGGLCTGCGVCTSESPLLKMKMDEDGFLVPQTIAEPDNNPIRVCPFNPEPDSVVQDEDKIAEIFFPKSSKYDDQIGRFENTYVGYSNKYRKTSSSGGIATYVFEKLLSERIVDYLYIVKEVNGSYAYQLFNNLDDITKISKTRYVPVTMENLFVEISQTQGKVAVSGVACFIKAIRLKQHYYPELKEKIPFLIGIICGGLKSEFFTDYLAQKSGITSGYSKQDYRIKDPKSTAGDYSFGAYDDESKFHSMKMRKVGDMWGTGLFKSNACDFCDDVTTELADISLGDAWIPPYIEDGLGTSVIVTRTKLADELIKDGVKTQNLIVEELNIDLFKLSQKGSYNHRHKGLKYRMDQRKKDNLLIPFKRKRILKNIPYEFKVVQKERGELRRLSLSVWKNNPNAEQYDDSLKTYKSKLKSYTKLYHRIQKVKSIIKLKTL